MKKVFRIHPNQDRYQSASSAIPLSACVRLEDVPTGGAWNAPSFYIVNPTLPRADFVRATGFGIACPLSLVKGRAESLIERDCDLFSCWIHLESQEYVIFRPKRILRTETLFLDGDEQAVRTLRGSAVSSSGWFRLGQDAEEVYLAIADDEAGEDLSIFLHQHTGLECTVAAQEFGR